MPGRALAGRDPVALRPSAGSPRDTGRARPNPPRRRDPPPPPSGARDRPWSAPARARPRPCAVASAAARFCCFCLLALLLDAWPDAVFSASCCRFAGPGARRSPAPRRFWCGEPVAAFCSLRAWRCSCSRRCRSSLLLPALLLRRLRAHARAPARPPAGAGLCHPRRWPGSRAAPAGRCRSGIRFEIEGQQRPAAPGAAPRSRRAPRSARAGSHS